MYMCIFQARKIGQELSAPDQAELDQTTKEQSNIQKQLEHFRRQHRQHQQLVQDYRTKQQVDEHNDAVFMACQWIYTYSVYFM